MITCKTVQQVNMKTLLRLVPADIGVQTAHVPWCKSSLWVSCGLWPVRGPLDDLGVSCIRLFAGCNGWNSTLCALQWLKASALTTSLVSQQTTYKYILVAASASLPQGCLLAGSFCNHSSCFADGSTSGQIYNRYSIYSHQHVTHFLYMSWKIGSHSSGTLLEWSCSGFSESNHEHQYTLRI